MTTQKSSQQILSEVQTGPVITLSDPTELRKFAQACDSALCLLECSPQTVLSLNEPATQNLIFGRLGTELDRKWGEYRVDHNLVEGSVPFGLFAKWICKQSKIEIIRQGNNKNTPNRSLAESRVTTDATITKPSQKTNLGVLARK